MKNQDSNDLHQQPAVTEAEELSAAFPLPPQMNAALDTPVDLPPVEAAREVNGVDWRHGRVRELAEQEERIRAGLEKLGIDVRCDGDRFLCDAAERAGVTFEQFVAALERSE